MTSYRYQDHSRYAENNESIYESVVPTQQFNQFSNPIYSHLDDNETKYSNILQSDSFMLSPKHQSRRLHQISQVQSTYSIQEPNYVTAKPSLQDYRNQHVRSQSLWQRPQTSNQDSFNGRQIFPVVSHNPQTTRQSQDRPIVHQDTSFGYYQGSNRSHSSVPMKQSVVILESNTSVDGNLGKLKKLQDSNRTSMNTNYPNPMPEITSSRPPLPPSIDRKQNLRQYGSIRPPKSKTDFRESANYNACSLF